MKTRTAVVPDFNQNEAIEAAAQTAGAYVGAATTALVSGLATGLFSAFRGAVAGAQVTIANIGNQEVPIVNTAAGKSLVPISSASDITAEELDLLRQLRAKKSQDQALVTNGH